MLSLSGLSLMAQEAKKEKLPPITANDVKVHPWTANLRQLKIDPKTKGIFDEHDVTVMEGKGETRIRITGKMKHMNGDVLGRSVGYLGKIALIPFSERTGSLTVGISSAGDEAQYLIVLEETDGKLHTLLIELEKGAIYHWSVAKEDRSITYSVSVDGVAKWSVGFVGKEVKSFGIGAFTRFEGQKVDLDFIISN